MARTRRTLTTQAVVEITPAGTQTGRVRKTKKTKSVNAKKAKETAASIAAATANITSGDVVNENLSSSDSETELVEDTNSGFTYVKINQALNLIPKFDGSNNTPIDAFIGKAGYALTLVAPKQKTVLERLIIGRITGKAQERLIDHERDSLDDIFKLLKRIYSTSKNYAQWSSELTNIGQKPRESVLEYAERIMRIIRNMSKIVEREYEPEEIPIQQKTIRREGIASFIRGLEYRLQSRVEGGKYESLQEAIDLAIRKEEELRASETIWDSMRSTARHVHHISRRSDHEHSSNYRTRSPRIRSRERVRNDSRDDRRNYPGRNHSRRDDSRDKKENYSNSRNFRGDRPRDKCTFCHRLGHNYDQCRTKNYWCQKCKVSGHSFDWCKYRNDNDTGNKARNPRNNSDSLNSERARRHGPASREHGAASPASNRKNEQ